MKILIVFIFLSVLFFLSPSKSHGFYDPLEKPNNKIGVHILFPTEIGEAARLINSGGGEWGYVTIPIQFSDRDLVKWQKFMDDARENKVIPIMRLSTEGDYFNTRVWRKPTEADLLDFANFLSSLKWPVQNRYIIIMNEVNRSDEWGGEAPNPEEYASLLSYAVEIFKSKSSDYFVIMGGMDNAAPQDGVNYFDNRIFIRRMHDFDATLFNRIDGFSSHSYPNPGFSQAPNYSGNGTTEYLSEKKMIDSYRNRPIPVFITETGWSSEVLTEETISRYTDAIFEYWNNDQSVVAVTPFILNAAGAFDVFSFIHNGEQLGRYKALEKITKIKGEPLLETQEVDRFETQVLGKSTRNFARIADVSGRYSEFLKMYFQVVLGI